FGRLELLLAEHEQGLPKKERLRIANHPSTLRRQGGAETADEDSKAAQGAMKVSRFFSATVASLLICRRVDVYGFNPSRRKFPYFRNPPPSSSSSSSSKSRRTAGEEDGWKEVEGVVD